MSILKRPEATEVGIGFVKGVLGAVPYIGGALNEAIFDVRSRIQQKRFELFVLEVAARVKLVEDRISTENMKSEEFVDLMDELMRNAVRTRSIAKTKMLADVASSLVCATSIPDADLIALYLRAIEI